MLTPCRYVMRNATQCIEDLNALKINPNKRIGVSVSPLSHTQGVMADVTTLAMFSNRTCVDSDWFKLTGQDTTSAPSWGRWRGQTKSHKGKTCSSFIYGNREREGSLRDAVLNCTDAQCAGIVWRQGEQTDGAVFTGAKHKFLFCAASAATTASVDHTVFLKKFPPAVKPVGRCVGGW